MKPQAKVVKIGPGGRARQRGEMWRSTWVIFLFDFYWIFCPPLEITVLHGTTPFCARWRVSVENDFL